MHAVLVAVFVMFARVAHPAQIPAGPSVAVTDGWYHVDSCSIAQGRKAPSMPLHDALRRKNTACPICEPLKRLPEWATFVAAHGPTIAEEVRVKEAADAAEAKRKADEVEAARLKRLADLDAERKSRETAPVPRLTEVQVRDLAKAAVAEANGDPQEFLTRFRARVRELSPDYAGPQIVHGSATLRVIASGPVAKFESAVADRLQKQQPWQTVVWSPEVSISVFPASADAPDIKQVVVQRSDAARPAGTEVTVTMIASTLAPRALPGAPAGSKLISSGDVSFSMSAFEPGTGVQVRVIAVPASGPPLSRIFVSLALRAIQ